MLTSRTQLYKNVCADIYEKRTLGSFWARVQIAPVKTTITGFKKEHLYSITDLINNIEELEYKPGSKTEKIKNKVLIYLKGIQDEV